jgi:hypothetical protein
MAMTRKALKAMGLSEEQIDSIIEMHTETVDGLREQVRTYKADAEKLPGIQEELDEMKKGGGEDWKGKYEAEKAAHDKTKNDHAAAETAAKVKAAYRAVLKEAGIADKYAETVLRATDLSGMKLDKDGALEGADELAKSAKAEWSDFVVTTTQTGASVATPPGNTGGKMTKEQIAQIKDPTARRAAIAENADLFKDM